MVVDEDDEIKRLEAQAEADNAAFLDAANEKADD